VWTVKANVSEPLLTAVDRTGGAVVTGLLAGGDG
jgi:hypothetical protein